MVSVVRRLNIGIFRCATKKAMTIMLKETILNNGRAHPCVFSTSLRLARRPRTQAPYSKDGIVSETNWDLFRMFSVVARTGSVNRAAHELGMSQPTLSRRLKELERYLAAPLFFRASSGVKLTQEGEDLQRSSSDMIRAFESFQRDLRSRVGKRSSVVRISATEGMTKHWLLPALRSCGGATAGFT